MYTRDPDGRLLMPDLPDDRQVTTALVARSAIALQHNVQRFRSIFNDVDESIVLLKPNGHPIDANPSAVKFMGIKVEETIDLPFWSAPCWSFASAVQQQLQESILQRRGYANARAAQGASIRYKTEVMGADNRPLPLDFSLTPIRDPQGETILILAQGRDLSTNERTGEHFHDRLYSERLAIAIRVAKAGAWSWDVNNQQVFWTPEFEILFDYEPGSTQQLYREWIDRVHPDDSLSGRLRQRERVETQLQ